MARAGKAKGRKDLSGAFNAKHSLRASGKAALGASLKSGGKNSNAASKNVAKNVKIKAKAAALSNPFEERDNRKQKRDVLNRNLKGSKRNVALARSLAHEKRKRTLLGEFKEMGKANSFQDKRFGEKNEDISEEEKMLERFKKLRSKRGLYDLSDTDGKGAANRKKSKVEFTHLGQSLSESGGADMEMEEEFKRLLREEGLDEDDGSDPGEKIDANALMEQIQSASNNDDRSKSKKEVMQEVIAKAKMFKLNRQREKEQDDEERERLDDAFKGLMSDGLFHLRPTRRQRQAKEMEDMMERLRKSKEAKSGEEQDTEQNDKPPKSTDDDDEDEDDDFDRTVRGLVFEARAAASDRTLTPEERAKREFEKLKEQQEALERRMKGHFSDEEESDDEDLSGKRRKRKNQPKKSFFESTGSDEEEAEEDDEEGEDEDEEADEDEEEGDSEDDDDDSDDSDADQELERHLLEQLALRKKEDEAKAKAKSTKRKGISIDRRADLIEEAKEELPFILDAPESHGDLLKLMDKYNCADKMGEVVKRIRTSNSIHLLAENREKMNRFLEILVDHYVWVVERHAAACNDFEEDTPEGLVTYNETLKACLKSIYELCHDIKDTAGQVFCNRLGRMQLTLGKQLSNAAAFGANAGGDFGCLSTHLSKGGSLYHRKKGGHKGAKGRMAMEQEKEELEEELELFGGGVRASDCRCWPSAGDLAFFRIVEAVFPVTDFRHPVVSPSQLLLGQYLAQCPIRGPRDVVACLCTAQLLVDFCRGAERLPGEAFLSVDALLNQAFPAKKSTSSNLDEAEKLDLAKRRVCPQMIKAGRCGVRSEHLDWLRKAKISKEAQPLSLTALRYDEDDTEDVSHVDNGVIVQSLLSLAQQLGHMAATSPVGDSLLQGIDAALQRAKGEEAKTISDVVSRDVKHVKASRKPMRLLDVQARAIKSIRPLFNENYKWTKDGHDPDRARAELKKLKRQAHRERKGVARELRKDAQFLAEQRETENQSRISALRAERQRNFAELTNQAGEMNKAVREFGATGGGSRNVDMRGRRRQTRQ